MTDDLDILFPKIQEIKTTGGLVKISEFKFKLYPKILVFANKYIAEISEQNWGYLVFGETIQLEKELARVKVTKVAELSPDALQNLEVREKELTDKIKLIQENGGEILADICEVIEISTGKNREFLDELYGHEVLDLLLACIEVNASFFKKILTERIDKITKLINPQKAQESDSKSPDSLEQGIS
jgi:hypothetical protein